MSGTYVESLNRALHQLCESDPTVVVLGEDILDPYGGAFKVTRGLSTRFPDRVLTTPISEAAIVGIAGGMALRGLKPIVEIMFGDFVTLAADQIVNHIAKYRAMYAGQVSVPVVIRAAMGGGRGYGPTHSQSLEKLFLGVPHLKVVAPSRFHDPGALLQAAVADPDPVLFVESKLLYPSSLFDASTEPALVAERLGPEPYPTVAISNFASGDPDVVVFSYAGGSRTLEPLLLRLANDEVRVRVVFPSLLNRLDAALLAREGLRATGGSIVWEEGTSSFDWGAEMVATLYRELPPDAPPVRRLASRPTVIPASKTLEKLVIPDGDVLEREILQLTSASFRRPLAGSRAAHLWR